MKRIAAAVVFTLSITIYGVTEHPRAQQSPSQKTRLSEQAKIESPVLKQNRPSGLFVAFGAYMTVQGFLYVTAATSMHALNYFNSTR